MKKKAKSKKGSKAKEGKRKAGVVAYRLTPQGELEFLLVTARRFPGSWVFPVGTVDPGETPAEAAARECLEEAGYEVVVGREVMTLLLDQGKQTNPFTFFLAEVAGETAVYEHDRERRWVTTATLPTLLSAVFAPVAETAVALLTPATHTPKTLSQMPTNGETQT